MPATAEQLAEKSGVSGWRVTLNKQHNSGFARGTPPARWADHGRDIHRRATEGRVPAGALRYPSYHLVLANCVVYVFRATGEPGHKWCSGSRAIHHYASFDCRCHRSVTIYLVPAECQPALDRSGHENPRKAYGSFFTVLRPRGNCPANHYCRAPCHIGEACGRRADVNRPRH